MHHLTIRPTGPYSLRSSLGRAPSLSVRTDGPRIDIVYRVDGTPVFARLSQGVDGEISARIDTEAPADRAVAELRFLLAVDDDHAGFLAMAASDPLLGDVVHRRRGWRPTRTSMAQALLHGFCGQLVSGREAWNIERRISTALATPHEGLLLPLSDEELRSARSPDFVSARLAPRRARALAHVAERISLSQLRQEPHDAAIARLRREPMIGPWTCGIVGLYGIGSYSYGLAGDLGLMRLSGNLLGRDATVDDTESLLARYAPWAGLASVHLLRHPLAGQRRGRSQAAANTLPSSSG